MAIEILLVEDNPGDVHLMTKLFTSAKVVNKLSVVKDGVEALKFLYRQGPYTVAPRPNLILLDLNLPKKNGGEVLATIKSDPALMRIPVVVLTSSEAEQDILQAYNLHANAYITKPVDLKQFVAVVESIRQFWLTMAKLPAD